jgi:NAD(P)-dependent dehydrogenase (short-subunit alcohol dehydrogenase family)
MTAAGGIVVTGASTGIGRASALALAKHGFQVFAGVRDETAAELLEASHERITAVQLDVTSAEQIDAAVRFVARELGTAPLAGLMNNAGIFSAAPLEFLPLGDLRLQLEVNVVGAVAVTQGFLPQLRESRGRIVITGSISGILTTPLVGGYCLTKAAVESIADSFRQELAPMGIPVSLLQLGAVETPLWDKSEAGAERFLASAPIELRPLYGGLIDQIEAMSVDHRNRAIAPEAIATHVVRAFTCARPRPRYILGGNVWSQFIISLLPSRWRDRILRTFLRRFA